MKFNINALQLGRALKNLSIFDSTAKVNVPYFYLTTENDLVRIETISIDGFYSEVVPAEILEKSTQSIKILNYEKLSSLLNLLDENEVLSFEAGENELILTQKSKKATKNFKFTIDYGEITAPIVNEQNNQKVTSLKGEEIKQIWTIIKGLEDKKAVREAIHYIGCIQGSPGTVFALNNYILTAIKIPEIQNAASISVEGFKKVAATCYPEQEYQIILNQDNIIFQGLTQKAIVPGKSILLFDIARFLRSYESAKIKIKDISRDELLTAVNTLYSLCGKDAIIEIKGADKIYLVGTDGTPDTPATVEGKEIINYKPDSDFLVKLNISFLRQCLNATSILREIAVINQHLCLVGKSQYEVIHFIMGIAS